jgi:hypothetical protein
MYGWMGMFLEAPERFDGFDSFPVFKSLSIIGQRLKNMNAPAPKI